MDGFVFGTCPESWVHQNLDDLRFVANERHVFQEGLMRIVCQGRKLGLWEGQLPDDGGPDQYYELSFSNVISMRIVDGLIDSEDIWKRLRTTIVAGRGRCGADEGR